MLMASAVLFIFISPRNPPDIRRVVHPPLQGGLGGSPPDIRRVVHPPLQGGLGGSPPDIRRVVHPPL